MTGKSFMDLLLSEKSGKLSKERSFALLCKERHDLGRTDGEQLSVGYPIRAIRNDNYLYLKNYKPNRRPVGDPEYDGMKNRQSKDYNDVGWDITEDNYSRCIDQIDAEATSDGWRHVGPQESIYGRFARSFKLKDRKGGIWFDVNDEFAKDCKKVEIRLVWLDKGFGKWTVSCNTEKKSDKTLFAVNNTNTGKWMEKTVLIDDAGFANKGERKSDIAISAKGNETTIFHL